jgi:subtilisin family serine protease
MTATGACAVLALAVTRPVGAALPPADEEWWFASWRVQQRVWPISKGSGVTVAVIDSPVNTRLPDFRGALVPGPGGDAPKDDDPETENHGTQMVSLIASRGITGGFYGLAPESKVMPILDDNGGKPLETSVKYAADHGAEVISMSLASPGPCPLGLQQAIDYAIKKDVVVAAGAGNEGDKGNPDNNPADCAGVLAVGAIDSKKNAVKEAQHKKFIAVAAPGVYVGGLSYNGKILSARWGTSPATALTAATVALVRAKYPRMPAREVVQRVINTTKDAGPPGRDDYTGAGVVMPAAALTADVPKSAPNPVFDRYDEWLAAQPKATPVEGGKPAGEKGGDSGALPANAVLVIGGAVVVTAVVVILVVVVGNGRKRKAAAERGPVAWGVPGARPPQPAQRPRPPQGQLPPRPGPGGPPPGPPYGSGRP